MFHVIRDNNYVIMPLVKGEVNNLSMFCLGSFSHFVCNTSHVT